MHVMHHGHIVSMISLAGNMNHESLPINAYQEGNAGETCCDIHAILTSQVVNSVHESHASHAMQANQANIVRQVVMHAYQIINLIQVV
jgi:hypothetical protein